MYKLETVNQITIPSTFANNPSIEGLSIVMLKSTGVD